MAQNTNIKKNIKFSNSDNILIDLGVGVSQPGFQVVIGGIVRPDLIDRVVLDDVSPDQKFTIYLKSSQSGRVQVFEDDRMFVGLPTPAQSLELKNGRVGWSYSRSFGDSDRDYSEGRYTSWSVLASFIFPGTAEVTPAKLSAVLSRSHSSGTSYVRMIDMGTGLEICSLNYTEKDKSTYLSTTLSNLPIGESIFEIQGKRSGSGRARIHFIGLK